MKPHRFLGLFAFALTMLAGGGSVPAAGADTCRHTDVVFYTTDTARLATELSKAVSACADYYLSITPTSAGGPRGGFPITTIRSLGPQFHAMAEIRFEHWSTYASTHGWYAAGVEVRRLMRAAGYDATLGDTWAINEVGAPSEKAMGVDVFKGSGSAREDLVEFVRGLYTGDDGVASRGLVFAADPLQVATDLAQYEQDLRSWYADSAFWSDITPYVRFWAQETYADARVWGVAGATLAERSAYLNDYFMHGIRLALREDGLTATARAFFAAAYTPVGNASFRKVPDPTTGIGFGYTDIGLPGMLDFVSSQTYALRSSSGDRFGYAVVPVVGAPATETLTVHASVARAIRDSESSPEGACGASSEWCDSSVPGAGFNDAWKRFANTLEGSPVVVQVAPGVSVAYAAVTARGATWVETSPASLAAPPRFQLRPGALEYDLTTTAAYAGPIEICVEYDPHAYEGYAPHLFHVTAADWTDVTTSTDASAVCGATETLGGFAILAADPTPPLITPHVNGPLGTNGWYTGDVTVTWSIVDPQSPSSIVTSGCGATSITEDTTGTNLTCAATSDGGPASVSVTVKRDATTPEVACQPTPSSLWPPNGKLVPVTVAMTVTDATAGPAGFLLSDAATSLGDPARDVVDFELGTPDVAGLLRAERPGRAAERVYALEYTAGDLAGNAAECVATVVVPHDRGG